MQRALLFAGALHVVVAGPTLLLKGERHTGTNFLHWVLEHNFGATVCSENDGACAACDASLKPSADCCWKHGYTQDSCAYDAATLVTLVRSPYPWLASMYDIPYESAADGCGSCMHYAISDEALHACCDHSGLDGFLNASFKSVDTMTGSSTYAATLDDNPSPMALWNTKVASYLNMSLHTVFVLHTDLYDLAKLNAKLLPLTKRGHALVGDGQTTITLPPFSDDGSNAKMSDSFTEEAYEASKAYEDNMEWLELWTDEELRIANAGLDAALMSKFDLPIVLSTNSTASLAFGNGGDEAATGAADAGDASPRGKHGPRASHALQPALADTPRRPTAAVAPARPSAGPSRGSVQWHRLRRDALDLGRRS